MTALVSIQNKQALTTSLLIAERFRKSHKHVLEKIDTLIRNLIVENSAVENYFLEDVYTNARNRQYRIFKITRDGFSLLAMSFTGRKALRFKTKFIIAFNRMETELKKIALGRQISIETRKVLTDYIKESGENERMHGHGFSTYTKLAYKLAGVEYEKKGTLQFRDSLDKKQIERVENIETMMQALIKAGKQYSEIKETLNLIFST